MATIPHNASLTAALGRWRITAAPDVDAAIVTADQVLYELRRRAEAHRRLRALGPMQVALRQARVVNRHPGGGF